MLSLDPSLAAYVGKRLSLITAYKVRPTSPEFQNLWSAGTGRVRAGPGGQMITPNSSGGRGFEAHSALNACIGEMLERHGATCEPAQPCLEATYSELDQRSRIISLDDLQVLRPEQVKGPDFFFRRMVESEKMRWLECDVLELGRNHREYLPLPRLTLAGGIASPYDIPTTNGLALGPTFEFAVQNAIAEIVERDAFLSHWWHQRSPPQLPLEELRKFDLGSLSRILDWVADRLVVLDVSHCWSVPTFVAVLWGRTENGEVPLVVGGKCSLNVEAAISGAILESVDIFNDLMRSKKARANHAHPPRVLASEILSFVDSANYYLDPDHAEHARFLCRGPRVSAAEIRSRSRPESLVHNVLKREARIAIADLTPTDLAQSGLWLVRALIPEAIPLNGGHVVRPLGCLSLRDSPVQDLNPYPHPYA